MLGRGTLEAQKNAQTRRVVHKILALRAERDSLSGRKTKTRRKMIGRELRQLEERLAAKGIKVPTEDTNKAGAASGSPSKRRADNISGASSSGAGERQHTVKRVRSGKAARVKLTRVERMEAAKAAENSRRYAQQYLANAGVDAGVADDDEVVGPASEGQGGGADASSRRGVAAGKSGKPSAPSSQSLPGIWADNNGLGDAKRQKRLRREAAQHGIGGTSATGFLVEGARTTFSRKDVARFQEWLKAHEQRLPTVVDAGEASSNLTEESVSVWDKVEMIKVHDQQRRLAEMKTRSSTQTKLTAVRGKDVRATSPYAVYARTALPRGTPLLRISTSACLGLHSCPLSKYVDGATPAGAGGFFGLALCVVLERWLGSRSSWHPLLAMYPVRSRSAVAWEDHCELEGTTAARLVEHDLQQLARLYSSIVKPFCDAARANVAAGDVSSANTSAIINVPSFQDFRDAYTIALSYGQPLTYGAAVSDSGDGTTGTPATFVLIPFVDLLNHSSAPGVKVSMPTDSADEQRTDIAAAGAADADQGSVASTKPSVAGHFVEIVVTQDVNKGEELYRTYGSAMTSRAEAIYRFGFSSFGYDRTAATEILPKVFDDVFGENAAVDAFSGLVGTPLGKDKTSALSLKLQFPQSDEPSPIAAEGSADAVPASSFEDLVFAARFVLAEPVDQDKWIGDGGVRKVFNAGDIPRLLREEYAFVIFVIIPEI
eukprot:INCI1073.2.p1 GENE.INCI1073.2~~INCI1073.2.p1  ORF type:complete len:715 (-),score=128.48 INCI1073.2:771-2915(-)